MLIIMLPSGVLLSLFISPSLKILSADCTLKYAVPKHSELFHIMGSKENSELLVVECVLNALKISGVISNYGVHLKQGAQIFY